MATVSSSSPSSSSSLLVSSSSSSFSLSLWLSLSRLFTGCRIMTIMLLTVQITTLMQSVAGYGSMGPLASLWTSKLPIDSYGMPTMAVCAIEVGTQRTRCWGSYNFYNDTLSPDIPLWGISGGGYFTCGLENDSHKPICWGQIVEAAVPSEFRQRSYLNIASGGTHACAVQANGSDTSGTVNCWGSNNWLESSPPPYPMSMVTSGMDFSCGLLKGDSTAQCWGYDISILEGAIPQPSSTSFHTISAGHFHVCGIELNTHTTICWGNNTSGQAVPPPSLEFSAISSGYDFSCGLRADSHEAFCWGDNSLGQIEIPQGVSFSTISSGDYYTCGVVEKGSSEEKVVCWGLNKDKYSLANAYVPPDLNAIMTVCTKQCDSTQHEVLSPVRQCLKEGDKICAQSCRGNCTMMGDSPQLPSLSSSLLVPLILCLASIGFVVICLLSIGLWRYYSRASSVVDASTLWSTKASKVVQFTSEELQLATQQYSLKLVVGQGSFGTVYKGILPNGQEVAVKKASISDERTTTFEMELQLLSRLHHKYLVNLVGYCQKEKVLVFEYMANGSLQDCLFGNRISHVLNWQSRVQVALQAARGLEYLHVYASPKVIHRDVKSANILLDKAWNAHLADFGLSLNGPLGSRSYLSRQFPVGTEGYLDPECTFPYKLTVASDVYSFGVVLLEILSGRGVLNNDFNEVVDGNTFTSLVPWARHLDSRGEHRGILDTRLEIPSEMAFGPLQAIITLALDCVRVPSNQRPSISKVVLKLQEIFDAFFMDESSII